MAWKLVGACAQNRLAWNIKSDSSGTPMVHGRRKFNHMGLLILDGCFKSNKILTNPNYIRTRLDSKRWEAKSNLELNLFRLDVS